MCKFIGKSNERILCELNKSEILRLYSIIHVAMETTKMSNFTCQSKSFISIFFTCQVSACELQPFSCHDLANDIHSQTAKTVFSHLKVSINERNYWVQNCANYWHHVLDVSEGSNMWQRLEGKISFLNCLFVYLFIYLFILLSAFLVFFSSYFFCYPCFFAFFHPHFSIRIFPSASAIRKYPVPVLQTPG